jgi:NADPH:quinone reductase-like Zn-dependent oxidoreductase
VGEDLACMAPRARMVLVGLLAGARADVDLGAILRKRLEIHGTVMRARPLDEKIAVTGVFARHLVPLVARGELKPIVDRIFPFGEAGAAHAYMAGNDLFGKIILAVE